ncbi:MAG: 4a-hydroxytetrahydrobiopterin dehydratase [Thermoleophilaceae bacterium]
MAEGTRLAMRMGETMAVLGEDEIQGRLSSLPGWRFEGGALRRVFKFEDFAASIDFVNRISAPAEEMGHHPDLEISWNTVSVSLSTHSQGGVTENDLELAARIDPLA